MAGTQTGASKAPLPRPTKRGGGRGFDLTAKELAQPYQPASETSEAGYVEAEVQALTRGLAGRLSQNTLWSVRKGTRALLGFLERHKKSVSKLTLSDFARFKRELVPKQSAEQDTLPWPVRHVLKGARCYLRFKAARLELHPSLGLILFPKGKRQVLPQDPLYREAVLFASSLRWLKTNQVAAYRNGALALLLFLKERGLMLQQLTPEAWDAFREVERERAGLAGVGSSSVCMRIAAARSFLAWKAEQGLIRKDQVYAPPRRRRESVMLPVGLAWLVPRLQEGLGVSGFAATTQRGYQSAVLRFLRYAKDEGVMDLQGITRELMTGYRIQLQQQTSARGSAYAVSTQIAALAALRFFFSWLVKTGALLADPSVHLEYPKAPKLLPRPLKVSEVSRLIARQGKTTLGLRDRAMLELFYGTGMRCAELAGLQIEDVDFDSRQVLIRQGKGRKDRLVPLGKRAKQALLDYLDLSRPKLMRGATSALFLSKTGRPIQSHSVSIRVRSLGERLSLRVTPHKLRHSCATHLLRGRADIRHIQRLLGHSSLQTTERYTKVEIGDLRAVLARCHPRERP